MNRPGYFKADSDGFNPQVLLPAPFMKNATVIDMRRYLDAHGIVTPLVYVPYKADPPAEIRRHLRSYLLMPPRNKKAEAEVAPEQLDIEQAIAAVAVPFNPASLIAEYFQLKAHDEEQSKRFGEYIKPTRDRMEAIRQELHAKALEQKVNGFPTDEGTAYLSQIVSHKIDPESAYTSIDGRTSTGRDAVLDWALDFWDDFGSEGITVNVLKAVVDRWREEHDGKPPPGLKLDTLVRCNIKRS